MWLLTDESASTEADSSSSSDDGSNSSLQVKEAHILQERRIGLLGAISLIVNKIIGAGYVSLSLTIIGQLLT
jgi:hypothetical protein